MSHINKLSFEELDKQIETLSAMPAFPKSVIDALHNYRVDRYANHPATRYWIDKNSADQSLTKR